MNDPDAERTDGLIHLAAALQRLGLMLIPIDPEHGIEHLPVPVIHRLAEILDTVPAKNRHQHLPPESDD
jgi:hypothetical protein